MLSLLFSQVRFSDLPGWADDDPAEAFAAFRRSAFQVLAKPYRQGSLGISMAALAPAFEAARSIDAAQRHNAHAFFETWFRPCRIVADGGKGFVTGFYEPEIAASLVRDSTFSVPFLRRPIDLVAVDEMNRPADLPPGIAFARACEGGLVEYFDRQAIDEGALDGRGLEIAFVESPIDAFFAHVQGAARLRMTDGSLRRITYAAKTGHPFTSIGRVLIEMGEVPEERMSMHAIRDWLQSHPEYVCRLLWKNRSYIFFRETPSEDPLLGPIAAAKVPLTPGRSIAVDKAFHTFGTPIFVDAPALVAFGGASFRRLMIAQDTGTAIVGPARGDLFAGSGDAAGAIAGGIRHLADLYALVPHSLFAGEGA